MILDLLVAEVFSVLRFMPDVSLTGAYPWAKAWHRCFTDVVFFRAVDWGVGAYGT